ncbi:MAG: cupredoxin domain-containing protein [Tepidisphaeraceae bacterium]
MFRALAIAASLLCVTAVTSAGGGRTHMVAIKDMKFSPASIEIDAGDSVEWANADDRDHTVEARDGSFRSGNMSSGDTFRHKFDKPGKFAYVCALHPRMKGQIVVKGE